MATDSESDTPIEDKKKPAGNFVSDMIWATVYVVLAAYGSSSFIYMLHISNDESRKFKNVDEGVRNGEEYSVLSGSYMYGPPYFPNEKNIVNFNEKKVRNPIDYSNEKFTKHKVDEQRKAINVSYSDTIGTDKFVNGLWDNNCKKKLDKFGKPLATQKYTPNSKSDSLHDWLYSNSTFCSPQNLKSGAYNDSVGSWADVTNNLMKRVIDVATSFVLPNNNPENLNSGQLSYRQRLWYNLYKYTFFIIIGTMAFSRNIMNKFLKFINFDNNEFEYWQKTTKNPFSRVPETDPDKINEKDRRIRRYQLIIAFVFAILSKSIYPLTITSGLFLGGIASFAFALWKWNFMSMLTWWPASMEQGPFMWAIYSIISLLCWILGAYLMFIVPGFIGQLMAFVIPVVIIGTLFIYPFYDKTEVYVKNPKASKYFTGNYALKSSDTPIESKARYNKDTKQCQFKSPIPGILPTVAKNVQIGPNTHTDSKKYTKLPDDSDDKPEAQYLLGPEVCYEKFIQKLSGYDYINHLVKKNLSLWITLLLHDGVRLLDADSGTHEIMGQKLTLFGDPTQSMSINMGTIPLLLVGFGKFISMVRNK